MWKSQDELITKAERYEAMSEEYVKAKGEASKLRGRLDDVVALAEKHIEVANAIIKINLSQSVDSHAQANLHMCERVLHIAKGENDER